MPSSRAGIGHDIHERERQDGLLKRSHFSKQNTIERSRLAVQERKVRRSPDHAASARSIGSYDVLSDTIASYITSIPPSASKRLLPSPGAPATSHKCALYPRRTNITTRPSTARPMLNKDDMNKPRVFVAVYSRPETTSLGSTLSTNTSSSSHSRSHKPTAQHYHWGIWIEPKGSTGAGTSFDLEDSVAHSSVYNPFGWRLLIAEHESLPSRMLVRLMVGKVVEGMTVADVANVLKEVQLPSDPGSRVVDVVAWIQAAIKALQGCGCAQTFAPEWFMEEALADAARSEGKGGREVGKVNYTWSRTFP
ncbi:hypothetical protein K458DRAFT_428358 [Lentithecium fluviatile CBS 122367]|uniref:Uncharacterized protein n=1 Tax=Lentithecium fluviatile CBS 122367 TaxID=1168545 RepID=A0A6G1JF70_9PLEO|nr:hypothetical protein K458DRAFT_428358 [Lentithecium fluviatile CBS 122367]